MQTPQLTRSLSCSVSVYYFFALRSTTVWPSSASCRCLYPYWAPPDRTWQAPPLSAWPAYSGRHMSVGCRPACSRTAMTSRSMLDFRADWHTNTWQQVVSSSYDVSSWVRPLPVNAENYDKTQLISKADLLTETFHCPYFIVNHKQTIFSRLDVFSVWSTLYPFVVRRK